MTRWDWLFALVLPPFWCVCLALVVGFPMLAAGDPGAGLLAPFVVLPAGFAFWQGVWGCVVRLWAGAWPGQWRRTVAALVDAVHRAAR